MNQQTTFLKKDKFPVSDTYEVIASFREELFVNFKHSSSSERNIGDSDSHVSFKSPPGYFLGDSSDFLEKH